MLLIYGELSQAQIDVEDRIPSLSASISFTNSEAVTRSQMIRLLDEALVEQAGIQVTHPEINRVLMRLLR